MTADTVFELILFALVAKKLYEIARGWCLRDREPLVTPPPRGGISPEDLTSSPGQEIPVRSTDELRRVTARSQFWRALNEVVSEVVRRELGFLVERPGQLSCDVLYVRELRGDALDIQVCVRSRGYVKRVPAELYEELTHGSLSATIYRVERWLEADLHPWLSEIASDVLYPSAVDPQPSSSLEDDVTLLSDPQARLPALPIFPDLTLR